MDVFTLPNRFYRIRGMCIRSRIPSTDSSGKFLLSTGKEIKAFFSDLGQAVAEAVRLEEGEAMNSKLPSFNAYYAICHKFGQTRKCLVHVRQGELLREEFGEDVIYWVERPEDEYGIARAIDSRQFACVLYRSDWNRGEVVDDERHRTKQFDVGDSVKVLRQIYDVVPVGAIVTIKEVRDENPGNCDPKTPGMFPPRYVYLFDYNGRECGASYDKFSNWEC